VRVAENGHERLHAIERGPGAATWHVRLEIDVIVQPLEGGIEIDKRRADHTYLRQ
jgi:hypothetical protein